MSESTTMNALYYHAARNFEVVTVPVPQIADDEIMLKVSFCGMCGTDCHIHEGEFITKFPLIPGHEVVGTISAIGKDVKGFELGDRCVADPGVTCENCFYCRRGRSLLCENFIGRGVSMAGGFAEFVVFEGTKVYKIHNLTDQEATLVEPAACAIHGMDKLNAAVGVDVLIVGAGPTGLILAQLLKLNGAAKVVIAANKGIKTEIAKQLDAGDVYIELDRNEPKAQWDNIKSDYPHGFDIVIEATGSEKVANDAFDFVRRGGTYMIYGVYSDKARVHWSPYKIFKNEIKIIGSFAQTHCFPRAVAYLESGKIKVKGMVTDVYNIKEYQKALDKMNSKAALKIVITP